MIIIYWVEVLSARADLSLNQNYVENITDSYVLVKSKFF